MEQEVLFLMMHDTVHYQPLKEEESEIFHRGRNAKKATKSKNASPVEYNRSTGLEAVIGFLYLTENTERIKELLSAISEEKFQIVAQVGAFKPSH